MPKNTLNKQHYQDFEVYLGTFMNNEFSWHKVAKYKDFTKAYKEFKKYVNKQLQYTEDELKKVWDTGRIDIELRRGSKLLNWVGIYARETEVMGDDKDKDENEDVEAEDSVDVEDNFKGEIVDTEVQDGRFKDYRWVVYVSYQDEEGQFIEEEIDQYVDSTAARNAADKLQMSHPDWNVEVKREYQGYGTNPDYKYENEDDIY